MQGFQPIYSGNTLTQAAGRAGQFIVAAGEARGRMYESIGKTVGGLAQMAGTAYAQYSAENAPVSASQVEAAEKMGVDFGRERIGGDNGIPQYAPVTQKQYDLAMKNQAQLATVKRSTLDEQRTLQAISEAGVRMDQLRQEIKLRDIGISGSSVPFPTGKLYEWSPLNTVFNLNPAFQQRAESPSMTDLFGNTW